MDFWHYAAWFQCDVSMCCCVTYSALKEAREAFKVYSSRSCVNVRGQASRQSVDDRYMSAGM